MHSASANLQEVPRIWRLAGPAAWCSSETCPRRSATHRLSGELRSRAESLNDEVDAVKPQAEFLFDEAGSPGDAEAIRSPVPPLADRNVLDLLIVEAEPG